MENLKLAYLLLNVFEDEDVQELEIIDEDRVEVDGSTYLVVTDEDATKKYIALEKDLYDDMGLSFVGEEGQTYMINNFVKSDWFDEEMHEYNRRCVEDDMSEEEKISEMEREGVDNEEDLIDALDNQCSDGIEWYKGAFGDIAFKNVVKEQDLLDLDDAIEWLMEQDGRCILSSENGEEIDLGHGYFAYKIG